MSGEAPLEKRARWAWAVFLAAFAVYLASSAPALAPYRDMGEMVSVAKTLGVAHPPGYPAYALVGKISTFLPFASTSYRLNLAAVAAGALSCALLYLLLVRLGLSSLPALLAAGLWMGAPGVWTLSTVTEMYSLNLAAAFLLLGLWLAAERPSAPDLYGIAFLGGFLLGFRLELVLLYPGLALGTYLRLRRSGARGAQVGKIAAIGALFFALGFSIYFSLLLRSRQHPLLNWNRPESLERLWATLARESHGGTLDLISENYAPGELFRTDLAIYLKDAARQFRWIGLPIAFLGFVWLFRKDKAALAATFLGWLFAGPYFIYKANMPPNPHALAILEAHFVLPNALIAIWIGCGLQWLVEMGERQASSSASPRKAATALGVILFVGAHLALSWRSTAKRWNFFGYDYGRHILATLPPRSILIMSKDVQLFTFWALQYAQGRRPDVAVVASGLAGSPWYIQMRGEAGVPVKLGPLRDAQDFQRFLADNPGRRIFCGLDKDVPFSAAYRQSPYGLVHELLPAGVKQNAPLDFLDDFYAYRGRYRYDEQKEFFSSDLIEDYSKAYFIRALEERPSPQGIESARRDWTRAVALDPNNAIAYYWRAFSFFQVRDYADAARDFSRAERLYGITTEEARAYHSLPGVASGIRNDRADALLNLGVALERLGRREEAEQAYLKGLDVKPDSARAHYNLAVLYWNRDWRQVAGHLQEALRIDPDNAEAKAIYPKALYALQMTQRGRTP